MPAIDHVVTLGRGRVLDQGSKATMLTADKLGQVFGAAVSVERRGDWYWTALQ